MLAKLNPLRQWKRNGKNNQNKVKISTVRMNMKKLVECFRRIRFPAKIMPDFLVASQMLVSLSPLILGGP